MKLLDYEDVSDDVYCEIKDMVAEDLDGSLERYIVFNVYLVIMAFVRGIAWEPIIVSINNTLKETT